MWIWGISGLGAASVVVGTTFFILNLLKEDKGIYLGDFDHYNGKEHGDKFNFKWYAESNGQQFMTNEEYKKFDDYLSTHLYYGPESDALKDIIFGNRNIIGPEELGLYFGQTRQIFINIEMFVNTHNLTYIQKRDAISEVIAHEYGHHFAYEYLKCFKPFPKISKVPTEITYIGNNQLVIWNKKYLDEWKVINHYDSTAKNPIDFYKETSNKVKYWNINHRISLSQLYKFANEKDHPNPFNRSLNYYWGLPWWSAISRSTFPTLDASKELSTQKYFYSVDEQFTRMTEMLMWPKKYFTSNGLQYNLDSDLMIPINNLNKGATSFWSPQAYDLAHIKEIKTLKSYNSSGPKGQDVLIYPNYPFGGKFYDDNGKVYNIQSYAKQYYDLLINIMGYGTPLAHIYTKNTSKIQYDNGQLIITGANPQNLNWVKLSGYTEKKYTYLAIEKPDGTLIKNIKLQSDEYKNGNDSLFHYFGRDSMNTTFNKNGDIYAVEQGNDQKKWIIPPKKYTYITKDYINMNTLHNNKLVLNTGTSTSVGFNTKLLDANSLSDFSGTRSLTTYSEYLSTNKLYWNIYANNDNISIDKNY